MSGYMNQLWTNDTLLAASTSTASGWIDVSQYDLLRIGRKMTGGTYSFEIDWSHDGSTVAVAATVAGTPPAVTEVPVYARFARFRVYNTNATTAFTAHHTFVQGKTN